ncbi:MAG: hypothetical protein WBP81_08680 [Solirubrobacteraceae bacterium]
MPRLEPLAGDDLPGDWGIAVVSRGAARLSRGGPERLTEFAAFHHEVDPRHAQSGWS